MSQRTALATAAWQAARAAGFPLLELDRGYVAHGQRPWRRFLDQAGLPDLRTAIARLDTRQFLGPTAKGAPTTPFRPGRAALKEQ
jgi:hypothetical protein